MEIENNSAMKLAVLRVEQDKTAIKYFKKEKTKCKGKSRDTYTKSDLQEYSNYTKKDIGKADSVLFKGSLPRDFVDRMNGDGNGIIEIHGYGDNLFEYDGVYFTRESIPKIPENYGAGAVITIGGKEYSFDENCRIDIPYGADIYNVKYPPVVRTIRD